MVNETLGEEARWRRQEGRIGDKLRADSFNVMADKTRKVFS